MLVQSITQIIQDIIFNIIYDECSSGWSLNVFKNDIFVNELKETMTSNRALYHKTKGNIMCKVAVDRAKR
jgi:hypothetical protein